MSQVTRKGEKPASSPALDAELRRLKNAEKRTSRLGMARVDLDSATWLFRNGHERAGWLRLITALYWMDATAHDLMAAVPR